MLTLEDLGWNPFFQQQLTEDADRSLLPARIAEELKGAYRIISPAGVQPECPASRSFRTPWVGLGSRAGPIWR